MNNSSICFGSIENQLSSCFNVRSSGTLAAVKLVHAYGYVKCNSTHWTFWGCGGNNKDVNFEIRKDTGSLATFHTKKEQNMDSWIPGYNPLSRELVLSFGSNPQQVAGGQKLCLTSLEGTSAEIAGKSCCDVYARFT